MKKFTSKQKIFLVLTGLFSGVVNGFFGTGAGLLLVPLIKKITNFEDKKIHATTVVCVLFLCLVGAGVYIVKKEVNFSVVLWCGIGTFIGSISGAFLLKRLKNNVINFLFSLVVMASGILMIIL